MSQEPVASSSKKRKSKPTTDKGSTNTPKNKLFATLESLEQTDQRAAKKRKQSFQHSIKQSRAANEESKLNGILVELRILIQRGLTAQQQGAEAQTEKTSNHDKVEEELDALLENLLVARRELMGHQLEEVGGKREVDYSKLILEKDESSSSDDEEETDSDSGSRNDSDHHTLPNILHNEYTALQSHWKSTLNKHHSNLALHSGLAVASKFQSKAVDVSFWEQVQSSVEHDRFKKERGQTSSETGSEILAFDDSKLYQHMLKDFISSGGGATSTNKKGVGIDPAQDAAERLKRAMRKKSGADVDLTALLHPDSADSGKILNGSSAKRNTVDRKASKGRKIRYVVHPKLVNFTFPIARKEPMIREDVWFKSLFGGVGRR
ncbi:hypothetical protein HJC23_007655 [Cyclotella cryptica]|uniref:Protein BFR2 n=1 Tax=Cyclotella cryptica TaxID=29204 RepID=A0ABD3NPF8_9STRA